MADFLTKLSTQSKLLMIGFIVGLLLVIVQGFSNAGSYTHWGETYEAGSVFVPKKVSYNWGEDSPYDTSLFNSLLDGATQSVINNINEELSSLRHKKIPGLILGLILTFGSAYRLGKSEEVKEILANKIM